jgi:flavin reductase (DIM6/NTAB) family NADH-FMN oxidoreductase RutF
LNSHRTSTDFRRVQLDPYPNQDTFAQGDRKERSEAVQRLMRHVPHPVAIITSTNVTTDSKGDPAHWRGATVSSFNTVSLRPTPIVSFNIKQRSSTFDAIRSSGFFNVHLLSEVDEAKTIAAKFAGGNASFPFHSGKGNLQHWAQPDDHPVADIALKSRLPPILKCNTALGHPILPYRLHCIYLDTKTVDISDHVVVFGKVMRLIHEESFSEGQAQASAMSYVGGRYARTIGA